MTKPTTDPKDGSPHPYINGVFWDATARQWTRHPAQRHAGVKWEGGPPPSKPAPTEPTK